MSNKSDGKSRGSASETENHNDKHDFSSSLPLCARSAFVTLCLHLGSSGSAGSCQTSLGALNSWFYRFSGDFSRCAEKLAAELDLRGSKAGLGSSGAERDLERRFECALEAKREEGNEKELKCNLQARFDKFFRWKKLKNFFKNFKLKIFDKI